MTNNPFNDPIPATAQCAVCEATVEPGPRALRVLFKAAFYYFCSHAHRVEFKRDLDVWADRAAALAIPVRQPPSSLPARRKGPFTIIEAPTQDETLGVDEVEKS